MQGYQSPDGTSVLTLELVEKVYSHLSSISFCSCRVVDIELHGWNSTVAKMLRHISKDLPYLKEWTELEGRALKWESGDRAPLLLLSSHEIAQWASWCLQSLKHDAQPPPSKLQIEFVEKSNIVATRKMRAMMSLRLTMILIILGLGVTATIMAVMSNKVTAPAPFSQEFFPGLRAPKLRYHCAA